MSDKRPGPFFQPNPRPAQPVVGPIGNVTHTSSLNVIRDSAEAQRLEIQQGPSGSLATDIARLCGRN